MTMPIAGAGFEPTILMEHQVPVCATDPPFSKHTGPLGTLGKTNLLTTLMSQLKDQGSPFEPRRSRPMGYTVDAYGSSRIPIPPCQALNERRRASRPSTTR